MKKITNIWFKHDHSFIINFSNLCRKSLIKRQNILHITIKDQHRISINIL